jgi:hypothetical protein
MEQKAAALLGVPVVAGAMIATRGTISKMALGGGGLVGALVEAGVDAVRKAKPPTTPGNRRGLVYMALTGNELAFLEVKNGFFSQSLVSVLAKHGRDEVAALDVHAGMVPKIHVALQDGTNYAMECGMMFVGRVKKLKAALGK